MTPTTEIKESAMNDGRQSNNADLAQTSSGLSESSTTMAAANHDSNVCVNRVSVKVPPFWPEQPEIWFAQIEAQFSISGINNTRCLHYQKERRNFKIVGHWYRSGEKKPMLKPMGFNIDTLCYEWFVKATNKNIVYTYRKQGKCFNKYTAMDIWMAHI